MKTGSRLAALALCLVLALGMAATAFAASAPSATEIAEEFMALLDAEGTEYEDGGVSDDGKYLMYITYPGEEIEEHSLVLLIDKNGLGFEVFEFDLLYYSDDDLLEVLSTVNELNRQYRFATFLADDSDHTIFAQMSGSLQGDAKQSAKVLHYAYDWLPIIVDQAWEELQAGVPEPGAGGSTGGGSAAGGSAGAENADFTGSWYFASITYTRDTGFATEGTILTAADLGYQHYVATFYDDGTVEFTSSREGGSFTADWEQDGNTARLSDNTGSYRVSLTDEDTLLVDADEDGGFTMTMVRQGSPAYRELLTQAA